MENISKRRWQSADIFLISQPSVFVHSHASLLSGASTDHPEELAGDNEVRWSLPIGLTNAIAHQVIKDVKIHCLQDPCSVCTFHQQHNYILSLGT